jgi:cell division protein FtsI (penicillin-binding protein 3)
VTYTWRIRLVQTILAMAILAIAVQLVRVQVLQAPRLEAQARDQALHQVSEPAVRGAVLDRHGNPLAVSTPVRTVYANPGKAQAGPQQVQRLASILDVSVERVRNRLAQQGSFTYLKRQVPPKVARRTQEMEIPGIKTVSESRRYYPTGPVAAHVVGFTGVDGNGLEGVELAHERTLAGDAGRMLVERDALGRDIRTLKVLDRVRMGDNLHLSLDGRIQYTAYQALKRAVSRYGAKAGMAVVLDPDTGEVLALANVPSYNPNDIASTEAAQRRNRAVTDAVEPGSIFKPFTVAAALEAGSITPDTVIDCENGMMRVSGHKLHDTHPMGRLPVRRVIQKSSNIGAAKIAMALENGQLFRILRDFGFGKRPGSSFPGESRGILHMPHQWQRFDRATLGFGHGVAASALQVARAYAVLAADGRRRPVALQRLAAEEVPRGERVISAETARQVTAMLELVVSEAGTGSRAQLDGYRVAGKTGTAQKPGPDGYLEGKYVASFAGFAPADDPELVTVVMVDEPTEAHYGGVVAAPVFRRIMAEGLRALRVPPRPEGEPNQPPEPLLQAGNAVGNPSHPDHAAGEALARDSQAGRPAS